MPSPSHAFTPLRIAVLGCGKIGSTFAFQLARGGHNVTVIARPLSARLQQLRRDKGIVTIKGERIDVTIADGLDEQTAYDLIIVTVVDYQVDALLPALERSAAKSIQFMFVSFEPERLRDAVGAERCSFGMPFVQAMIDKDGKLNPSISKSQKTIMSEKRWVNVFNHAEIPAAYEADMPLWLRCHVPLCIGFESVAVAGERRGGGASWGRSKGRSSRRQGKFCVDQRPWISDLSKVESTPKRSSNLPYNLCAVDVLACEIDARIARKRKRGMQGTDR